LSEKIVKALTLPGLHAGQDMALLALRLVTGAFLLHGVIDNIASTQRMDEFARFLERHRFPMSDVMAPLSVWVQFFCGGAFIAGACTRWAGLLCSINFVVACLMIHRQDDFRGWWPALVLVLIGILLSTIGAGRFSIDENVWARANRGA
jgi:putative oxidoreductase